MEEEKQINLEDSSLGRMILKLITIKSRAQQFDFGKLFDALDQLKANIQVCQCNIKRNPSMMSKRPSKPVQFNTTLIHPTISTKSTSTKMMSPHMISTFKTYKTPESASKKPLPKSKANLQKPKTSRKLLAPERPRIPLPLRPKLQNTTRLLKPSIKL